MRRIARIEQVALSGVTQRPVDVFARTIDSRKRLLVQQTYEAVLISHLFQNRHDQLLVIRCNVGGFKQGRNFKLARCNFIVACLGRNTQLVQFTVHVAHESQHALRDYTEIVVFKFLSLRRLRTE